MLYDEIIEMIDSSAHTLFHLLRSALGSQSAEMIPSDIDWKEVIDLSFEQGVAAVAVDGLQRSLELKAYSLENGELALDSPEMEDLKYEWFGEVFQAEEDYRNCKQAIDNLAKFYQSIGIRMMVLKGYGLSLNYPIPEYRPTGDIDVFVFEDKNRLEVSTGLGTPKMI